MDHPLRLFNSYSVFSNIGTILQSINGGKFIYLVSIAAIQTNDLADTSLRL